MNEANPSIDVLPCFMCPFGNFDTHYCENEKSPYYGRVADDDLNPDCGCFENACPLGGDEE